MQATSTVVDRQGVRINFRYASCRIVTPNCRIYMQISLQYYSFVHWKRPLGIKRKASVTWDPKLQSILLSLHASLLLLSPHLVTESIAAAGVALMREVRVNRAASQAAEGVTIGTGTLRSITVLARRRDGSVELDAVIPGTKDAALSTASVTVTGAARDVTETDVAGLAVPEVSTNDKKEERSEDDRQGNDKSLARRELLVGFLGEIFRVEVEIQSRRLGLLERVVAVAVEGEGDVVRMLDVVALDIERPVAPSGRDGGIGEVLVLLPLSVRSVENVEAGSDHEGRVVGGLGLVEEIGVPGDFTGDVSK